MTRARDTFNREELQRIMDALERANPNYNDAYHTLRVALGIHPQTTSTPIVSPTLKKEEGMELI